MEKIALIFLYTLYKAQNKVRVIFLPFIPGCFSFTSNATNFFIHSLNRVALKKNAYALLVFFIWVPYIQLSHMIPGVNIIGRKKSVVSINRAGGPGGVPSPQWGS